MRRSLWALDIFLLCAFLNAGAAAEEFSGYGPIPVRNFQPIQLIFLNLPFERARVLAPGAIEVHLESAESNEIATHQDGIDALLKFETNRTVLGARTGLGHGTDISVDVPFISRFGGFLDPFVDSIEDLFGTSNPERSQFPNNSFAGFHVRRGDVSLFEGKRQYLELGDVWATVKHELWHADGLPLIAARLALKVPTGRAGSVFGSGKPDFGAGLAAEHRTLDWLILYGNLNLIYPVGPITPGHLTLNPMLTEAVAAEARAFRHVSFVLQQETYTSPIHGTGTRLLNGTTVELTAGMNVVWDRFVFQFGAIDNISPVATAADFTVLLRLNAVIGDF